MTDIALQIKGGLIEMGIASGAESMTRDYGVSPACLIRAWITLEGDLSLRPGSAPHSDEDHLKASGY